ncbi:MAG TPA: alpha/beta fold hydrolase [Phycisphaerae bacterium]|nr:alpha/beta fold hydrolase [Phycisphaerae bacterium]
MTPRLVLLLLSLLLPACNDFLSERLIAPPNALSPTRGSTSNHLSIPVGPPSATLAAWINEPSTPARGTILLLHGFINDHSQVLPAAKALTAAGYRTVCIDLRGHGQSTGEHLTFGVDDARDLAQVTDYLQARNLCGKRVGVYGASYGAATAILFAGRDARVTAVVAVAPFSSLRAEAPYFGKHVLPVPGLFLSDADYRYVVNRMGRLAHFDPDDASPLAAIQETRAHVRLFHGDVDMIIPVEASRELAAAAPGRTQLTILRGKGHLAACFDVFGELREESRGWFDRFLAPETR